MTEEEARRVRQGDEVEYRGKLHRVISITTRGVAAPHFRLEGVEGRVSYTLCGNKTVVKESIPDAFRKAFEDK